MHAAYDDDPEYRAELARVMRRLEIPSVVILRPVPAARRPNRSTVILTVGLSLLLMVPTVMLLVHFLFANG